MIQLKYTKIRGITVGVHIVTEYGEEHNYTIKLAFKTTNNET